MYGITRLSGPTGPGIVVSSTQAYGMNSGGRVVGTAYGQAFDPNLGYAAYFQIGWRWSSGTVDLSLPFPSSSILYAINANGDAVGLRGFDNTPTEVAILVRGNASQDLSAAVGSPSAGMDINDAGQVCGPSNRAEAFIYNVNSGSVDWIPPLPGSKSASASAINQSGQVLGTTNDGRAFLFDAGVIRDLGAVAFAADINDAGVAVGSLEAGYPRVFLGAFCDTTRAQASWTLIPPPPGFIGSHADAINDAGEIVGTCWTETSANSDQTAYIHRNGVSTDLNTLIDESGWKLEFATDIDNLGRITGIGSFQGQSTSFLLTPRRDRPFGTIHVPEIVGMLLGAVDVDGGGWTILPNGPVPIDPWGPYLALAPEKRDALLALAMDEMAMYLTAPAAREQVRRTLIEVAQSQLGNLAKNTGEGRSPPTSGRTRTTRPPMKEGKLGAAHSRTQSRGRVVM